MFEFNQYEPGRHTAAPIRPAREYTSLSGEVDQLSLLIWAEHCVECAAPACYATCDLYERRPDGRCRRFQYGISRNTHFSSLRQFGAEVVFKKWAKLECRGNTRLMRKSRLLRLEQALGAGLRLIGRAGSVVGWLTRDARWRYIQHVLQERYSRYLHRTGAADSHPDAFLLEIYNPEEKPTRLQLRMAMAKEASSDGREPVQRIAPFHTAVECLPGFNRLVVPRHEFDHITRSRRPFDIAIVPDDESMAHLVFLMADFVSFTGMRLQPGGVPGIKCVVWDLDNTLWHGTLIEGDDVVLREKIVEVLRTLDERGILCSIASKNDPASAMERLTQFGIAEFFVYPQIGWHPKSQGVRRLAERLNLGLDTFAFVDDNPFELAEVGAAIPEVLLIGIENIDGIVKHDRLQGSTTADAKRRREFYRTAMLREEHQAEHGDDYLAFLASCRITLEIMPYAEDDASRVAELVQRTNQLNFSGAKYRREDLEPILADETIEKHVLKCSDRFGSYGTVGFSLVSRSVDEILVRDMMLSCRVQGKLIEQAFFHFLASGGPGTSPRLRVRFIRTPRNEPARQVLEAMGFAPALDGAGLTLDLERNPLECRCITLVVPNPISGGAESKTIARSS